MKIGKKIFIYFSLLALILIILFFTISRYVFNQSFERYKIKSVENEDKEYINLVEDIYIQNNGAINNEDVKLIQNSLKDRVELKFTDGDGNLLWEINMRSSGGTMGMGHGRGQSENISYTTYDIRDNGDFYGILNIGRFGRYNLSQEDLDFQESLNNGILIITLISIVITLLISMFFSKELSKPILKIKDSAEKIRDGKGNWEIKEKTNTYELDELLKTVNSLGKTLEAQENLRLRLTSDVSHELRTPLNIMQNQIEAMQDGIIEINEDRLEEVRQEILRLSNLSKDLEKLTDISNYDLKLNLTDTNIGEFIKKELNSFKNSYNKKDIQIEYKNLLNRDVTIPIDRGKFKQVLLNLFSNAEKYSDKNVHIKVVLEKDPKNIIIRVIDRGIGIPESSKDYIFERFYREEMSRNRKTGGAGLGLSIVKGIVEAHNGKIYLNTSNVEETEFTIKLPVSDLL
jgi:signal transduction histidine kinase